MAADGEPAHAESDPGDPGEYASAAPSGALSGGYGFAAQEYGDDSDAESIAQDEADEEDAADDEADAAGWETYVDHGAADDETVSPSWEKYIDQVAADDKSVSPSWEKYIDQVAADDKSVPANWQSYGNQDETDDEVTAGEEISEAEDLATDQVPSQHPISDQGTPVDPDQQDEDSPAERDTPADHYPYGDRATPAGGDVSGAEELSAGAPMDHGSPLEEMVTAAQKMESVQHVPPGQDAPANLASSDHHDPEDGSASADDQKTEPAPGLASTPNQAPRRILFDPGFLLGWNLRTKLGGIPINTRDERLAGVLQRALRLEHSKTASLMLLDVDGEHLRIAAALGLSREQVRETRLRLGEGVAGKALVSRQPEVLKGRMTRAEEGNDTLHWLATSVPVLVSGQPMGILSVNAEAAGEITDLVLPLARLAEELPAAILGALDLSRFRGSARRAALHQQVDRFLCLEDSIPARLRYIAEALRGAVSADYVHLLLADPVGRRFESLTPDRGLSALKRGAIPIDRGFFGWVMRHQQPRVLEAFDEKSSERVGIVCYPISTSRPHSLIVLENVPLNDLPKEELLEMLKDILGQVEEMISIEENFALQELNSELQMRIADQTGQLENLPSDQRIPSLLEFTVTLVAAEVAVWIPGDNQQPVMTRAQSRQATLIESWGDFQELAQWTREKGAEAEGVVARWWDPGAPAGPAPYVGVPAPAGEGVLLVFFPPEEEAGATNQIPAHLLWRVLTQLIEAITHEQDVAKMEGVETLEPESEPDPGQVLGAGAFWKLVRRERQRSQSSEQLFSLTRFELLGESVDEHPRSRTLLDFLLRLKDDRDLLSEIKPGIFVILSPGIGDYSEVTSQLLAERWRAEQPRLRLLTDHHVFPEDGDANALLNVWLGWDKQTSEAA
jgi:hypothetical protein